MLRPFIQNSNNGITEVGLSTRLPASTQQFSLSLVLLFIQNPFLARAVLGPHYWAINQNWLWLAATSYVTKDITGPGDYGGFPAVHLHE
ncbi:uncharacterized protein LOC103933001 isoform X1 [Pyrus x bretschneideri]|uniref:uncharacterized protein LOC103933001 isoform X1 n=1 Tax=Pyrus x bretschneideri TaxID=225117 RepID=UPI00202FE23C|nr:uncharacterized protein LOC103933001 isoform X1 [Pyrus x bretschneideri]